jgi:DNA-binding NarL/FixJ family response regulator
MTPQRVLLVEDDDTTAAFVCQQLIDGGLVPETVHGGLEALRKAHNMRFALAIVDIDIASEPDGAETADWLRRLYGVPVVVFSMKGDPVGTEHRVPSDQPGMSWGGPGEVSTVRELIATVLSAGVRSGQLPPGPDAVLPRWPSVAERGVPAGQSATGLAMPPGFAELSGREWQIIRDLIDTPSAQAVALKRQRSRHTVHNHLKSIFRKLQVHSVAELLSLMIRLGRHSPTI